MIVEPNHQEQLWDQFVASQPDSGFMQSSWWAELMNTWRWSSFGMVVEDDSGIVGGARIMRREFAPGWCFYYIAEGPVLPTDPEDATQVFNAVVDFARDQCQHDPCQVSHLRLEPRWDQLPDYVTGFQRAHNWYEPRETLCVDLKLSEADLLAQMKPKGRYNIKVAQRRGVTIVEDTTAQGIRDFVALHHATFERKELYAKNESYFRLLVSTLVALNHGSLFFAEYQGDRLATVMPIYFGKRATYFFGGSTSAHRNTMAPYLLHFEVMRKAQQLGCEEYDFYGIAPQDKRDHPWASISSFKRKFGGYEQNFIRPADYVFDAEGYAEYLHERQSRRNNQQ